MYSKDGCVETIVKFALSQNLPTVPKLLATGVATMVLLCLTDQTGLNPTENLGCIVKGKV